MAVMKSGKSATIDDMYNMPKDGQKYELVRGEIVVSPGNWRHAKIATRITHILATFLDVSPVGEVYCDNLGIILPNGNLLSPDGVFIRAEKLPHREPPEAFAEVVPDFVVEVLSPTDVPAQVTAKLKEYLTSGVSIVWTVDPTLRSITVHRTISRAEHYSGDDTIAVEPLIPGFSCQVSRFFQ